MARQPIIQLLNQSLHLNVTSIHHYSSQYTAPEKSGHAYVQVSTDTQTTKHWDTHLTTNHANTIPCIAPDLREEATENASYVEVNGERRHVLGRPWQNATFRQERQAKWDKDISKMHLSSHQVLNDMTDSH